MFLSAAAICDCFYNHEMPNSCIFQYFHLLLFSVCFHLYVFEIHLIEAGYLQAQIFSNCFLLLPFSHHHET